MQLNLSVQPEGAAFEDDAGNLNLWELAAILRGVADRLTREGIVHGKTYSLRDSNGNHCGSYALQGPK